MNEDLQKMIESTRRCLLGHEISEQIEALPITRKEKNRIDDYIIKRIKNGYHFSRRSVSSVIKDSMKTLRIRGN